MSQTQQSINAAVNFCYTTDIPGNLLANIDKKNGDTKRWQDQIWHNSIDKNHSRCSQQMRETKK